MTQHTFAVCALATACLLVGCDVRRPDGALGYWDSSDPVEVAQGHGVRGAWCQNESHFDYVDDPTVAIGDDAHVAVAWVDQSRKDVVFQTFAHSGQPQLPNATNISSSPATFSWMPRLAIAPDDRRRVYALWQEIVFSGGGHGGEILFAQSADGGATFSPPLNLSNSIAGEGKGRLTANRWDNGSHDLLRGPDGRIHAAWTEYEGLLWTSTSSDGGLSFAEPVYVAGSSSEPARAPSLAATEDGTLYLAWSQMGQRATGIRVAKSPDSGLSFETPRILASSGHADAPRIAIDNLDTLHLVFGDSPAGLSGPYRIRYTCAHGADGAFLPPMTIASAAGVSLNFPNLSVDRSGRFFVTWQTASSAEVPSRGIGFTISRNRGRSFAPAEIVPRSDDPRLGVNGSQQGSLMTRLAVNSEGTLAIVNSTFASGRSSRIWLWRRSTRP